MSAAGRSPSRRMRVSTIFQRLSSLGAGGLWYGMGMCPLQSGAVLRPGRDAPAPLVDARSWGLDRSRAAARRSAGSRGARRQPTPGRRQPHRARRDHTDRRSPRTGPHRPTSGGRIARRTGTTGPRGIGALPALRPCGPATVRPAAVPPCDRAAAAAVAAPAIAGRLGAAAAAARRRRRRRLGAAAAAGGGRRRARWAGGGGRRRRRRRRRCPEQSCCSDWAPARSRITPKWHFAGIAEHEASGSEQGICSTAPCPMRVPVPVPRAPCLCPMPVPVPRAPCAVPLPVPRAPCPVPRAPCPMPVPHAPARAPCPVPRACPRAPSPRPGSRTPPTRARTTVARPGRRQRARRMLGPRVRAAMKSA